MIPARDLPRVRGNLYAVRHSYQTKLSIGFGENYEHDIEVTKHAALECRTGLL